MIEPSFEPTTLLAAPEIEAEATRRVLERLEEYTQLVIRPLNMRHTGIELLSVYGNRVEVKISTRGDHHTLIIAPQAALLAEFFWLKAATIQKLPAPRVQVHDLTATSLPFCYILVNFISGMALTDILQPAHQRVAARQIGRSLRRIHQLPAAGYGYQQLNGRWSQRGWRETLIHWLDRAGALELGLTALGEEGFERLIALTLDHPDLACPDPKVIHGAIGPQRTLVTIAETAQLESLPPPGRIVAGDPLLDIAMALLPQHSAAFRQGFLEGYTAAGPLDTAQRLRLRRLGLLTRMEYAARNHEEADMLGSRLHEAILKLKAE